jgi:Protein of unknown function (DUF2924)
VRRWRVPAAIAAEIERIRSLRLEALRRQWRLMFGRAPPAGLSKDLLGRMITARLQERAFGGLDRDSLRFLQSLARQERLPRRQLKPRTILRSRVPRPAPYRHERPRRLNLQAHSPPKNENRQYLEPVVSPADQWSAGTTLARVILIPQCRLFACKLRIARLRRTATTAPPAGAAMTADQIRRVFGALFRAVAMRRAARNFETFCGVGRDSSSGWDQPEQASRGAARRALTAK